MGMLREFGNRIMSRGQRQAATEAEAERQGYLHQAAKLADATVPLHHRAGSGHSPRDPVQPRRAPRDRGIPP
jgi:hypothetical protein